MEMRSAEVQIVVCTSLNKSAEAPPVFFTGGGSASKMAAASANRKYKIFTQV